MKRHYPFGLLQDHTRTFIILWRQKKQYDSSPYIDIADCLEILKGTPAFHKDTSFEGGLMFDYLIDLKEFKIGWDGDELIDLLIWYIESYVKQRLAKAQLLM